MQQVALNTYLGIALLKALKQMDFLHEQERIKKTFV